MVLFNGDVEVSYGFIHLDSGVGGWDGDVDQRAGQRNGLLGAAQPGFLLLSTAMHTGLVPLRVEAHQSAPPLDHACDEIVEVSWDVRGPDVELSTFEWETSFVLPEGGPHRVRLSARDFEAGRAEERYKPEDPVRDSYVLQLWPAAMAPDEIIKATTPPAAYWHTVSLQHPIEPLSPHEQALAGQRELDEVVARQKAFARAEFLGKWGGRDPSPRLLHVQQDALALARERRDLVDAIVTLSADRQRALAVGLARRVCTADDGPLDWQPALDALAAGRPLPSPFDDQDAVFARLFPPDPFTVTVTNAVGYIGAAPPRVPIDTGVTADATIRAAAAADPLEAALRAVNAASWSVLDRDAYFVDVAEIIARS